MNKTNRNSCHDQSQSRHETNGHAKWRMRLAAITLLCFYLPTTAASAQSEQLQHFSTQYGHQSNWQTGIELKPTTRFRAAWQKDVGEGRSQIVVDGKRVFVHVGENEKRKNKPDLIHSRLLCLERETGNEIWKHESETAEMLAGQETFSGAPVSPRSTPVLVDDAIITITYTGVVECLEVDTGKVRWTLDLVDDLNADPVQFGFSASPVALDTADQQVFIAAAGKDAGLFCLNTADGSRIWRAESKSFSYATPTFATWEGKTQIISITREEVLGIDVSDGATLWQHPLAEKGLTNVPSPIIFEDGLLISGQGIKGTRRIKVSRIDDEWTTEQLWFARRIQFFYSNWSRFGNVVLGCENGVLLAFNIKDGSVLGKWRGFNDGNLVRAGDVTLIIDGKGSLNLLADNFTDDTRGFDHYSKIKVLDQRCWTPPTLFVGGMLIRGGDELAMLKFCQQDEDAFPNLIKEPKRLKLRNATTKKSELVDHVGDIFATFETKGAGSALSMYSKLRKQQPSPLRETDRIALYEAAKENGLGDLAKMILEHAVEDFPDSDEIRELAQERNR